MNLDLLWHMGQQIFKPQFLTQALVKTSLTVNSQVEETGPLPVTLQRLPVCIRLEKCLHSNSVIL